MKELGKTKALIIRSVKLFLSFTFLESSWGPERQQAKQPDHTPWCQCLEDWTADACCIDDDDDEDDDDDDDDDDEDDDDNDDADDHDDDDDDNEDDNEDVLNKLFNKWLWRLSWWVP